MSERKNLKDWARSCHYDWMISVKEVKGKRWTNVLNFLEVFFDFDIGDYNTIDEQWNVILSSINKLDNDQVAHLNRKRRNQ